MLFIDAVKITVNIPIEYWEITLRNNKEAYYTYIIPEEINGSPKKLPTDKNFYTYFLKNTSRNISSLVSKEICSLIRLSSFLVKTKPNATLFFTYGIFHGWHETRNILVNFSNWNHIMFSGSETGVNKI